MSLELQGPQEKQEQRLPSFCPSLATQLLSGGHPPPPCDCGFLPSLSSPSCFSPGLRLLLTHDFFFLIAPCVPFPSVHLLNISCVPTTDPGSSSQNRQKSVIMELTF